MMRPVETYLEVEERFLEARHGGRRGYKDDFVVSMIAQICDRCDDPVRKDDESNDSP
jgi:hypothetical protein